MSRNEADTRAQLIDPALHARGWTEELVKREETLGPIEIVDGQPRRAARGRTDYTLRVKVAPDAQPVAVAVIEAKSEAKHPAYGLEQGKLYAVAQRLNVPFVYATNGHLFVEFDAKTGRTTPDPLPVAAFPTPDDLRRRWEEATGVSELSGPPSAPQRPHRDRRGSSLTRRTPRMGRLRPSGGDVRWIRG